jgi:hypothetical protein
LKENLRRAVCHMVTINEAIAVSKRGIAHLFPLGDQRLNTYLRRC